MKKITLSLAINFVLSIFLNIHAQSNVSDNTTIKATIKIDNLNGHTLMEGCSGFNVRIADKVWGYNHPDFRKAVHELRPGWLRYFSGTMGDGFNSATGMYDIDYAWMHTEKQMYLTGFKFSEIKGPQRIADLYSLMGEINGKIVVTVNGFTETPDIIAELARFVKNNNIEVEVWQFCNEPYFYVPHREIYWWNDGYDYAVKMKPYADSVLSVLPNAKLSLNCSWDGVWSFFKEVNTYQKEYGHYWNVFSKHSYAPHTGGSEAFEQAYKRGNSKLIEVTSPEAMQDIEKYSWKGAPLLITEFGVWNKALDGIYSAIYNAEYTLRQLQHTNAFLIASHEISNKYSPEKNLNKLIINAYNNGTYLNTDSLITGIHKDDEGKAMEIIHRATDNTTYTWDTYITGAAKVPGLKNKELEGTYAKAFKGYDGFNYLAVTNRSGKEHEFTIFFGDKKLDEKLYRRYMATNNPLDKDVEVKDDTVSSDPLKVPPYSIVLVKWKTNEMQIPLPVRIYNAQIVKDGVQLFWWDRQQADSYIVCYGESQSKKQSTIKITGHANNHFILKNLKPYKKYLFSIIAVNSKGKSQTSNIIEEYIDKPETPQIFKSARRDNTITIFWRSVPYANGYKVIVKTPDGSSKSYDAKNVFGYRIEKLEFDKPYTISVFAYNGLGDGKPSETITVSCNKNIPLPVRDVCATETPKGTIYLKWVINDTICSNIKYKVLRGKELHKFSVLADNITSNSFTDTTNNGSSKFFYTVKSYTPEGETNFYPNIATVIKKENAVLVNIDSIVKKNDHFLIYSKYNNIKTDGEITYGISISDISYLTEEETQILSISADKNSFVVKVPFASLKEGHTYSIKAFVNTNGQPLYSLPPFSNIKF